MSRFLTLALAGAAFATPALAQGPFDGTWKADISSVKIAAKPDQFMIVNGVYSCTSCTPATTVPADGKFHKVMGHDYYDEKSVEVVDPSTVRLINRRAGKVVATATWAVSADGNTLTQSYSSTDTANGQTVNSTATETRLAPPPAGAHAVSGSWQAAPASQMSDNILTVMIKTTGKAVTMSFPTGEHFTAMLGGSFVPVIGDTGGQMAAAKMTAPGTLELSYKHKAAVDEVDTIVAAPAGDTLAMTSVDKRQGNSSTITLRKQ